ncbi:hypothetical protein DITRI_Ditri06bG0166100 [Diplodiscus trichospermus]
MASPKCYFILALLATSLFINPALAAVDEPTQQLIDKICRQMEEYAFCNDTFNQNVLGPSADIRALTQITVEQSSSNATNTHSFITDLLERTTDPAEKNALITCENAYHQLIDGFSQATLAFFQQDFDSMLEAERRLPRALASCTDIFNTPPNPPNPIGDRNKQMRILTAMAIAAGTDLTA